MGLDMYLTASNYLYESRESDVKVSETIKKIVDTPFRIESVKVELAYWRKANQIYSWFLKNVQNGEDVGQHADVSTEQLSELLETVKKVLNDHSLAEALLPTQSGLFFGDTSYGERYFSDLEETKEMLEKVLAWKEVENWYIEYHASW